LVYENIENDFTIAGDESGDFSSSGYRVTWADVRRDDEGYCYKDYGSGHFALADSIQHDFDFHLTDRDAPDRDGNLSTLIQIWVLANAVGSLQDLLNAAENLITVTFEPEARTATNNYISLVEWKSSNGASTRVAGWQRSDDVMDIGDTVYIRVKITGDACTCDIYGSAANRTAESSALDNLSITLSSSSLTFQYLYAAQSRESIDEFESDGYVENLDINEAVAAPLGSIVNLAHGMGIFAKNRIPKLPRPRFNMPKFTPRMVT